MTFQIQIDAAQQAPQGHPEPRFWNPWEAGKLAIDVRRIATPFADHAAMGMMGEDDEDDSDLPNWLEASGVAVVQIDGPLLQRAIRGWFLSFTGYDHIAEEIDERLSDPRTKALVLRINSPGGMIAGMFEGTRAIRASIARHGKPVVAYVDEDAFSAAYAIAACADRIVVPRTGSVGSIGAIFCRYDVSENDAKFGLRITAFTSGSAKAYGNPHVAMDDAESARWQAQIDALGSMFAEEVAAARKMTRDDVLAMNAQTFTGEDAITAKLADQIGGFEDAKALGLALAATRAAAPTPGPGPVSSRTAPEMPASALAAQASTNSTHAPQPHAQPTVVGARATESTAMSTTILALLGAADETAAIAKFQALSARAADGDALLAAVGATSVPQAQAKLDAMRAEADGAKALRKDLDDAQRAIVGLRLTAAVSAGLISPAKAEDLRAKPVAFVSEYLSEFVTEDGSAKPGAKALVPTSPVRVSDKQPDPQGLNVDTATARALGLSVEQLQEAHRAVQSGAMAVQIQSTTT